MYDFYNGIPILLLPSYYSYLIQASNALHVALNKAMDTPCATEDGIKKLKNLYSDLSGFMEELKKREETNR